MTKKRRRVVPPVLWRLFHKRARTLADTLIALIPSPLPPSSAECRRKGRRCLGSGDESIAFLLRPNDPPDYRKLLTKCFVVVSETAPLFSLYDHHKRWSQLEIVRRTIETVISEKSSSSNLLCAGYDKRRHTSSILDLLTSTAWKLLLKRVGDVLMAYLLRNTSIFLPFPKKQHHQVAGYPINNLCFTLSKHVPSSLNRDPSTSHLGSGKKRKRVNEVNLVSVKQPAFSSLKSDLSSSNACVGCNHNAYLTQSNRHQRNVFSLTRSEKYDALARAKCDDNRRYPPKTSPNSSNQTVQLSKKRTREWSWQRRRKRRQLSLQGSSSLIPCTEDLLENHHLPRELQYESNPRSNCQGKRELWCPCCLGFQTLPKAIEEAWINRRSIFYKLEDCSSMFPRNHILNSLKPNSSGANALFRDIFGYFESDIPAQSLLCSHRICCRMKSICLYHSVMKLLKLLIRSARRCNILKLLDKHCDVPLLEQKADGDAGSMLEGDDSRRTLLEKEYDRVQHKRRLPFGEVHGFHVSCGKSRPETQDYQFEPSKSFCSQKQVTAFIWAVCRSIVPPDLLGAPSNWRILRNNISRFVRLRRFESFSLKQCLHNLKMSKFPAFSSQHSSCYLGNYALELSEGHRVNMCKVHGKLDAMEFLKNKILECWIYWLFSSLVVPLVRVNFYVTESEHGKQEVFYYRKAVWEKLITKAVSCLKSQSYCLLNDASVRSILRHRSFGFSRVRLCPKNNGVRVLANLKSSSRMPVKHSSVIVPYNRLKKLSCRPRNVKYNYFKSVNSVLHNVHFVLKCIKMKEPEKLGSSVFDYSDIYKRLIPFILQLRSGSTIMPEVFIVVSDVARAFDSVHQDKLLSVVNDVISNDEYILQNSLEVACTKYSLYVHQQLSHLDSMPKSRNGTRTITHSSQTVLVKQGCRKIIKDKILSDLFEHIKRNVLQLDSRFYLQAVGIPQGSVVSSLLCSFYYGHMENNLVYPYLENVGELLAEEISGKQYSDGASTGWGKYEDNSILCKPKCLLLRMIDDFLFISTSKEQASRFLSRLQRGFHEYNCYMNGEKFGLNFDMNHTSESQSNKVSVGEDGISFLRWAGLLINCCTLEIQADYSRYLGSHLSSTLTVSRQGKADRKLKAKLRDYLHPKCHPIFYDSNINSPAIVRLNIYQAFVLCAMKFHCYVSILSSTSKLNTKSFIYILVSSLRYMHKLIKKRMHSVHIDFEFRPLLEVDKWEVEWLGLVAFIQVLKRKQSRYRELLYLLRSKLMNHQKAESISTALEYAVDDAHSSILWKIKY